MPPDALRIVDASINRAREALRVAEDYARFLVEDRDSAERLKRLRHELGSFAAALGAEALLAARDIGGDVGRDTRTGGERFRAGAPEVVRAAFARAQEALRCIAEFSKIPADRRGDAESIEQIRYATYELEQTLVLRGERRAKLARGGLYVIITESLCRRGWLECAREVLCGGAIALQLREKALPDAELLRRARELTALAGEHGALFFVNDRADIAAAAGADGVHIGQDDLPPSDARRVIGPRALLGISTHNLEQLERAAAQPVDAIALGPMFPTTTKDAGPLAGRQTLAAARARTTLPLIAIGGIDPSNAGCLRNAGADLLCVCSAVIGSTDPRRAAAALVERLNSSPAGSPMPS